jgi:cellulose synthase/poly-beta-1,6-N-acetylglucosamine synthase-like glycosyltransferase
MLSSYLPSITLLITAWKEPISVARNIQTVFDNKLNLEIVLIAPDLETRNAARDIFQVNGFTSFKILTDPQTGKPNAINLALKEINSDWIICTDGDIVLYPDSIPTLINEIYNLGLQKENPYQECDQQKRGTGAISARPISIDSKDNFWGYIGNLLADSADVKRSQSQNYFVSGYLCAYKQNQIQSLPKETLVDDAQFSIQILQQNLDIKYVLDSKVGVKYPTNLKDWLIQKRRSAGGYRELKYQIKSLNLQSTQRSLANEMEFILYPIQYAKSFKQLVYSLGLYPLRLLLWVLVFKDGIIKPKEAWERVESTKILQ